MPTLIENTKLLQKFAGVAEDGAFGPQTAAALVERLALVAAPVIEKTRLRVCIDPGHGMGNRKPGVFDPGCERGHLREADVVLKWAHLLGDMLEKGGAHVAFTRTGNAQPAPLLARHRVVENHGCTHLVSLHVNDADSPSATGTETLVGSTGSAAFAGEIQNALVANLGLRNRGVKFRDDLAVLKVPCVAVLVELGFIEADAATITDEDTIFKTCRAIADVILKQ